MKPGEAVADEGPRIVVTFADADIQIAPEGVSPSQIFLAAWLLETWAHEVRVAMVMESAQRASPRIVVPH